MPRSTAQLRGQQVVITAPANGLIRGTVGQATAFNDATITVKPRLRPGAEEAVIATEDAKKAAKKDCEDAEERRKGVSEGRRGCSAGSWSHGTGNEHGINGQVRREHQSQQRVPRHRQQPRWVQSRSRRLSLSQWHRRGRGSVDNGHGRSAEARRISNGRGGLSILARRVYRGQTRGAANGSQRRPCPAFLAT